MCNWRKWIWPGILTVVILTALANWFRGGLIEEDLTAKSMDGLAAAHPWASVALDRRDLTLRGTAPSREAAADALKLADEAYDVRIAIDATEPLAIASPYKLDIEKAEGAIVVSGNVPDHKTRADILAAVNENAAGATVEDKLELAAGAPEGFAAFATYSAGLMPNFVSGKASMSDTNFSVSGITGSQGDFENVTNRIGALPQGFSLADQAIVPPAVSPYRFSASKRPAGIVLSGNVPSTDARTQVIDLAKSEFGADAVTSRLSLASGAPSDASPAREVLLKNLARLDAGQANMVDNTVSISGRVEDAAVAAQIDSDLQQNLPTGYTASTNILVPAVEPEIPVADPFVWTLQKNEAGIVVSGNVASARRGQDNVDRVKAALGVGEVGNEQVIALGAPDGIADARAFVAKQIRYLESGEGTISGNTITIKGKVKNKNLAGLVERNVAGRVPEGYTGTAELEFPDSEVVIAKPVTVLPPVANPYVWSLSKSEAGIAVTGNVASDEVGASVLQATKSAFGVSEVSDGQTVARGKPERIDEARAFVTRQIRLLDEGMGVISNQQISIKGKAKNRNLAGLITRTVENRAPAGYTGSAELSFPESEVVKAKPVEILPPVADPFRWSVSKIPSGVTVLGNVSSEADGNAIAAKTKSILGVSELADRQTVARGKPEDFDGVRELVLRQVQLLEAGQGNIVGKTVSVTGRANSEADRNLINGNIVGGVPQGYVGSTNIVFPKAVVVEEPKPAVDSAEVCRQKIINAVDGRQIRFETARAIIKGESKPVLDDVVKAAIDCPDVRFQIGGHTDSRGRDTYNQELSKARADAVVNYIRTAGNRGRTS